MGSANEIVFVVSDYLRHMTKIKQRHSMFSTINSGYVSLNCSCLCNPVSHLKHPIYALLDKGHNVGEILWLFFPRIFEQ